MLQINKWQYLIGVASSISKKYLRMRDPTGKNRRRVLLLLRLQQFLWLLDAFFLLICERHVQRTARITDGIVSL